MKMKISVSTLLWVVLVWLMLMLLSIARHAESATASGVSSVVPTTNVVVNQMGETSVEKQAATSGPPHPVFTETLPTSSTGPKRYRVVHVQVVHRHGDRTPITPMKDETFWASQLPAPELLEKLSRETTLQKDPNQPSTTAHLASGVGPFGKLTQLGILQMVDLGSRLRERLELNAATVGEDEEDFVDMEGNVFVRRGRLFHSKRQPFLPTSIKALSTNFPRTIQSIQAVLIGLFSEETLKDPVLVDVRHTSTMIPDPQPRRSQEQIDLEVALSKRPYVMERETQVHHVAVRTTQSLRPLLSEDAFKVSFGVGEEKSVDDQVQALSWGQLAEISKCLQVRGMLPDSISSSDYETVAEYTAWKWFQSLRDARLSFLAMNTMITRMIEEAKKAIANDDAPPLTLYSAHDSTLMGLLCAFHLEQPAKWPEYGSYFIMELIEVSSVSANKDDSSDYYVRFSLNGDVLRSNWEDADENKEEMFLIPLNLLAQKAASVGSGIHEAQ